ncbi:alpha/beta fold hydrolase [soil metagenome]
MSLADLEADCGTTRTVRIHGHDVAYRMAGSGPAVVLVHGVAGSCETWAGVMPALARHHTVVAPDLLGHGQSAKPRGDYSLGAYACGIRDLLAVLGVERATMVGHSLGGGVSMQLAYQFPELCERLVLVASGGLGKEVTPLLRLLSMPGAEYIFPLVASRPVGDLAENAGRLADRVAPSLGEACRIVARLADTRAQRAFLHTVRAVIDQAGQRVSARDRLYLASAIPTLLVWGDRDRIIPVDHAYAAHELMPGSRLVVVKGAGHFLPLERPELLLTLLEDFLATTTPAAPSTSWRDLLTSASAEAG